MDICWKCTLELPLWGNSKVYQQLNYATEIKETYFQIYTKTSIMSIGFPFFANQY